MVEPQSQEVLDAVQSSVENPNFMFDSADSHSFATQMLNDLLTAGLKVAVFDAATLNFEFVVPNQVTQDADVLLFENVESSKYIAAGFLTALIMSRFAGSEYVWRGKAVVLIAGSNNWDNPELKSRLEDLIERGTII